MSLTTYILFPKAGAFEQGMFDILDASGEENPDWDPEIFAKKVLLCH